MMKNLVRLSLYGWLGAGGYEEDEGGAGGGGQPDVFGHLRDHQNDGESCYTVPLCLSGADGGEEDEGGAGGGGQRVRRRGAQALELPVPRYAGHSNT
jgi:hypothetical protein